MTGSENQFDPKNETFEGSDVIGGIGSGRQKNLNAVEKKDTLDKIDSLNSLEEMKEAVYEISLKRADKWYKSPPTDVLDTVDRVYERLPEEAQEEFITDRIILKRINAARRAFNKWLGRFERQQKIPSPVEAGPSKYPAEKARQKSRLEREANQGVNERLDKLESGVRGARQRSLEAIGSSVAEQNEKEAKNRIERRREALEKGTILIFRDPRLYMGAVYRVNQKSVRIQLNEPRSGTKPMSDEEYGDFRRTTISLDSDHLQIIQEDEYDEYDPVDDQLSNLDHWPETYSDAQQLFLGGGWEDSN